MLAAETESHEGKRKVESLWPIFKIHHQKSRYIYDLFYRRKAISRGKLHVLCSKTSTVNLYIKNIGLRWENNKAKNNLLEHLFLIAAK